MKINVLRNLVIPWVLLFILALGGAIVAGMVYHIQAVDHSAYFISIGLGILLCFVSNINTLSTAGIWITHSLPSSLRYNSWPWIISAIKASLLAGFIYLVGLISFVPLFWQAFVIPIVFTIALFVIVWRLMGPILTWSSNMVLSRVAAWMISLPVFALIPLMAIFLGQNITTAYISSRPDLVIMTSQKSGEQPQDSSPAEVSVVPRAKLPPVIEKRVETLQALAESGKSCAEDSKLIQSSLDPKAPDEVVYWAIKATQCAQMKSIVGLPKLVKIMMEHPSEKNRVEAIKAMPRFGRENVKQIAYLLYKRIGENYSQEMIKATAIVLANLGEVEKKTATRRLESLLESKISGSVIAQILIDNMKQDEIVAEFVVQNLSSGTENRERAITMICQLPLKTRALVEPMIDQVVASVKTGAKEDPAKIALSCLGKPAFQAIQKEVIHPEKLERSIAARTLSELDFKNSPEVLSTVGACVTDVNDQVRKYCSYSLGKIGVDALPKILDLLKSNDLNLKDAGHTALEHIEDPMAKPELERIRAENSGWMANKKKLQIAKAVDTALIKLENENGPQN